MHVIRSLITKSISRRNFEHQTKPARVLPYRDRKEGERQQLADLVGKNLTYISQLEGLDFKLYKVPCSADQPATHVVYS